MQLILSAISAGGVIGIADQYLCLFIMGIAARFGFINLMPQMSFMSSTWFLILAGLLWVLTVAPAYSSFIAPGIMNAINAAVNFVSGFVVPISSAMLSLASVGAIVNLDPQLRAMFDTLQVFNSSGGLGSTGYVIATGSAVTAVALTGMKAAAKPAIGAGTGTTGHLAAPIFATYEAIASFVIMGIVYALTKINPALLIGLLVVVVILSIVVLSWAIYQLWQLKRGIGKMLRLAQEHPRAGLSVAVEFVAWGLGWLVWGHYARATIMLCVWALMLVALVVGPGVVAFFPPLSVMVFGVLLSIYLIIGFNSAGALLQNLEKQDLSTPGTAVANA
jgi:hypothetical protein